MQNFISLRQHKILLLLLSHTEYVTGKEIAESLGVTSRTVRNDIYEINNSLKDNGIQINSIRGQGYLLPADSYPIVREIIKEKNTFYDQPDRVRYLTIQLCLSDEPLDIFDLEEEMSVSHTTFMNDIKTLKKQVTYSDTNIQITIEKNTICFENNELKRREILNHILRKNWDYNSNGNLYYGHEFLSDRTLRFIINSSYDPYKKYDILLEDTAFIAINLAIAIAHYRIATGHILTGSTKIPISDSDSKRAADELLNILEPKLGITFPAVEREEIYHKIACCRVIKPDRISPNMLPAFFPPQTRTIADAYLFKIKDAFSIDLSESSSFYICLVLFIRSMIVPYKYYKDPENPLYIKQHFYVEIEFSYLFQKVAAEYLGIHMNETDVFYLSQSVSGALNEYFSLHPEHRLRTILLCHLGPNTTWAMQRKLENYFSDIIEFTDGIPVFKKANYDFSDTDLVISTVHKILREVGNTDIIHVSPVLTSNDFQKLENYIHDSFPERYYHYKNIPVYEMLLTAFKFNHLKAETPYDIIERMCSDMLRSNIINYDFLYDILQRESISTFALQPSIILVYSLLPAKETHLAVATLNEAIQWKGERIHIVIVAALSRQDTYKIFALKKAIYKTYYNAETLKSVCDIDDLFRYYLHYKPDSEYGLTFDPED